MKTITNVSQLKSLRKDDCILTYIRLHTNERYCSFMKVFKNEGGRIYFENINFYETVNNKKGQNITIRRGLETSKLIIEMQPETWIDLGLAGSYEGSSSRKKDPDEIHCILDEKEVMCNILMLMI